MASIEPAFLTSRNLLNVVRQVSTSAVLGIGYTLVIGSGNFDLSIGTQLGLCGIVMAMLSKVVQLPIALGIGIVFGTLISMSSAVIINLFNLPAFIVTVAASNVFRGASFLITKMVPVAGLSKEFIFIGQGYLGPFPVPVYIMVFVGIIMYFIINRTLLGRHAISAGGNVEAAQVCGVKVKKIRLAVYGIMGAYAAVGGIILTGRSASAQVTAGQGLELDIIAAVVIGGTSMRGGNGNIAGTVFGCLLVGVVNNGLNLTGIDANWQVVAKGLLILFAIIMDVLSSRLLEKIRNRKKA